MSHEISIQNGVAEMAYLETMGTPWHGLGSPLRPDAPIEEWQEKSMPFSVKRSKIRYVTPHMQGEAVTGNVNAIREWPEQHVLFRSDTMAPLGVVSDGYKVVQPAAVLEFFRDLVSGYGFQLKTAGTLKGGRIYWAMAQINGEVMIAKGQPMRGNVLLSTSCDGSRKTEAANISTDVVCMNTLRMADSEAGATRVRVSHRSVFDAEAVKQTLGIARTSFEQFIGNVRILAARKTNALEAERFVLNLLAKAAEPTAEQKAEILAMRAAKAILAKYAGAGKGADLPGRAGTAWGLVSAVTEYVDHDVAARSNDNRLTSAWFGPGGDLKSKALEIGLAMV